VDRGLVTAEGAKRYGVVIAADGSVDEAATTALRDELRAKRGETEMFNFGGSIEEIKARCKAETHLDPPVPPTFAQARNG
jgi:N-methylhydantoinase B